MVSLYGHSRGDKTWPELLTRPFVTRIWPIKHYPQYVQVKKTWFLFKWFGLLLTCLTCITHFFNPTHLKISSSFFNPTHLRNYYYYFFGYLKKFFFNPPIWQIPSSKSTSSLPKNQNSCRALWFLKQVMQVGSGWPMLRTSWDYRTHFKNGLDMVWSSTCDTLVNPICFDLTQTPLHTCMIR